MLNKPQKLGLGISLLLIVDIIWVASSELTKYLYKDENFDKPFFCTFFKTSMFTIYLVVMGMIAPWREACMRNGNYQLVEPQDDTDGFFTNGLSDSTFVPIKTPETESDDSSIRSVRFSKLAEVREMNAAEATEALMSRLSYAASIRIRRQRTHHKTARTALIFCILWFIANYMFQLALDPSEAALVTLLSTTSSIFTLVLAASFPSSSGDRFTVSKLIAVSLSMCGATMVTMSEISEPQSSRGIVLSVLSAFFYACYLVLVKRKNDTDEKIDIIEFFGFVGLWNTLLLWPLFIVLNFSQLESFEMPNKKQFLILFINGLIGTVISEALWLWGCFLTSSLIATVAITLTIPFSMILDVVLRNKVYPLNFYLGSIPMFLSLIFIAFLMKYEDGDPIMKGLKVVYRKIWNCRRTNIVRIQDDEQNESLIDNSHDN
ncbi:unnamed protein product [Chironomus riparius]|uniref:Solute carrier family 35 member F5 n=1 Tax=Chironomus riparius TaxID=315576 RepID=A0A9N9RQ87_9DIPT|nr:unnamed protein product [Chironomus riparius]